MADFERLEDYLRRANYHYERVIENPARIQEVDESMTESLAALRSAGVDLDDEEQVFAFILAISIAYRHGHLTVEQKCGNPMCATAFVTHHNQSHGDLALVTRTLARNLGLELPRYAEDE